MKRTEQFSTNVISVALAFGLLTAPLAARAGDSSVKERLDQAGMKYEIDKDGDYKVTIDFKRERRTQMVFVSGTTESVSGFTVRKIFSPAGTVAIDGIDGAKALELLRDSRGKKLGSWEIEGANLYLVMKLPDTLSSAQLLALMMIAGSLADDMEIKLSGADDAL